MRSRTICLMSTYPVVLTSPATTTSPVVSRVSTATRLWGSCRIISSRTESLIWSAILSGCPSVTDSEVKRRPVTMSAAPGSRSAVSCEIWRIGGHDSLRDPRGHAPVDGRSVGPVGSGAGPEAAGDLVPDGMGEGGLGAAGYV